jgi:hypothetical protein
MAFVDVRMPQAGAGVETITRFWRFTRLQVVVCCCLFRLFLGGNDSEKWCLVIWSF